MRRVACLAVLLVTACAGGIPDHVELQPGAENVEIVSEPPSPNGYKELGRVTGVAVGADPDVAADAAKNDLRNKAAALGADLVTLDENLGKPVPLSRTVKVEVSGRAYKAVE